MWWLISCVNLMWLRDAQRAGKVGVAVSVSGRVGRLSQTENLRWSSARLVGITELLRLQLEQKGLGKNPLPLNWNTHLLLLSDTADACSQAFWLGLGLKPALFSELQMGIELYHWFSWFSRAGQELSHPPLLCESVPTINPYLSICHLSPTGSVSLGNP